MRSRWKFAAMLAALAMVPLLMAPTGGGVPQRLSVRSVRVGKVGAPIIPPTACDSCFLNVVDSTTVPGVATQGFFSKNVSTAVTAKNFAFEAGNSVSGHELAMGVTSSTFTGAFWTGGPTGEQTFISSNAEPFCLGIFLTPALCAIGTNSVTSVDVGNTTDNPAFNFKGTGTATLGGNLVVTGASATVGGNAVGVATSGTFTASLNGCTTTCGTATLSSWSKTGNVGCVQISNGGTGTSNSAVFNIGGLPAAISPVVSGGIISGIVVATDNGVAGAKAWSIANGGTTITLYNALDTGVGNNTWTTSGAKGIPNGFQACWRV